MKCWLVNSVVAGAVAMCAEVRVGGYLSESKIIHFLATGTQAVLINSRLLSE